MFSSTAYYKKVHLEGIINISGCNKLMNIMLNHYTEDMLRMKFPHG